MREHLSALLALLLLAPAVRAQRRPVSLDEAVAAALEASPALHASRMKAEASAARAREAAASRLPSLRLGAGYTRLSEVPPFEVTLPFSPTPIVVSPNFFNSWNLRLAVQQPVFTGFRLEAGAEAARMLERSAGFDLARDRSELVFAVKSAYWGLVRARDTEAAVAETVAQVREHLKDVRAFFDQGLLVRNEVLRAELQLSNAELAGIDARNAVEIARTALNSLMGLPVGTDLEPTTSAESQASRVPLETESGNEAAAVPRGLLDAALAGRPELRAAEFRVKASEAGLKAAKAGLYPQVSLAGGFQYLRPNPRYMPALDRFKSTWDVGLAVSYDLWNWGQTRRQAEQARAQLAQARDARDLLEDQAVLEVTQSRLALARARRKTGVAAAAVGQADENLRLVRERFRQGVALNTEVLDAEVFLLQARTARVQASIDLVLAQARLEKALGN
ncbi:MAG TPA: TolC family protein [Candidatus Aminicenantes bacterium]|nr:TolC family protein [Candidatus Aminicenantes bacterium]